MEMTKKFEKNTFSKRLKSMIFVDFRRMFTSKLFYIMFGIALVMPILILVMTSMMEGSPMMDQNQNPIYDEFGNPVLMEGFKNVWQIIGSSSSANSGSNPAMSMDLVSMCNINLVFFMASVLVCLFVTDDFKSGYSKNLFTVRSNKTDYVISKSLITFIGSALLILAFFIGSILGGAIAGVSFEIEGATITNVILSVIAKMFLVLVFVSIYVLASVIAKQKTWLSMIISLGVGMLLFMMIPSLTPLDSTIINVILCLVGGLLFAFGLGAISRLLLKKRDIL